MPPFRRPRGHTAPAAQPQAPQRLASSSSAPSAALRRTRPRSRQLPLRHARGRPDRHCRAATAACAHALPATRRRHPVHPRLRSRQRRLPLRGHARARLPRPPQGRSAVRHRPLRDSAHRGGRSIRGGRAQAALHGRPVRDPLRDLLRAPHRRRQAAQGRPRRCHAPARRPARSCARTAPGGPSRPPASWRPPRETAAGPRIPADPAGKTRLHGSSSPLFPANPLDNEPEAVVSLDFRFSDSIRADNRADLRWPVSSNRTLESLTCVRDSGALSATLKRRPSL